MKEYITKDEVKKVCGDIKIRDWSELTEAAVTEDEAAVILKAVNESNMAIPLEDFKIGLEVELEHGTRYRDANVTNNHPLLTGKIVIAHLKESLDYYKQLEVVEIEGDLLKAVKARDMAKVDQKYRKLVKAKLDLYNAEKAQLK